MAIVNLLHLDAGEKIKAIIPIQSFEQGGCLMMATKKGVVKKTDLQDYCNINKNGLIAVNLREEDELIGVQLTNDEDDIVLVTRNGLSIRFMDADIRSTGRNTQGVRGISLAEYDEVIGMAPTDSEKTLLVVSEKGFGKRTDLDEYRVQSRGGKGLITYKPSEKTGLLVGIALVEDNNDIVLINDLGVMIRMSAAEIPVLSRITQGVTLMRVRDGKVVDLAIVDQEACVEDDEDILIDQSGEIIPETAAAEGTES
jgi:DNA gyrase subunit A